MRVPTTYHMEVRSLGNGQLQRYVHAHEKHLAYSLIVCSHPDMACSVIYSQLTLINAHERGHLPPGKCLTLGNMALVACRTPMVHTNICLVLVAASF